MRAASLFEQWRDMAVTYDPDLAMKMLDEAGVIDQDGDGFRDLPSGKELVLRIDISATASDEHVLTDEIVKENWEAVGLKTIINPVPGEQLGVMQDSSEIDIRGAWEVGDGPNHLVYPQWGCPDWQ